RPRLTSQKPTRSKAPIVPIWHHTAISADPDKTSEVPQFAMGHQYAREGSDRSVMENWSLDHDDGQSDLAECKPGQEAGRLPEQARLQNWHSILSRNAPRKCHGLIAMQDRLD